MTPTAPPSSRSGSTRTVWIDAQLPPALARWFRDKHGTDAAHVDELGFRHARDAEIFAAARAASGSVVVVTKDDDFVKLLDRQGPPPQVVWVRCGNVTNSQLRRILDEAWSRAVALLDTGEPLVELRRRLDEPSS